jgi:hypothetical protein
MVHYLPIKKTNKMVITLLIKKTSLITSDMLKSTCPIWQGDLFDPYPNLVFFYHNSWFEKPKILIVFSTKPMRWEEILGCMFFVLGG